MNEYEKEAVGEYTVYKFSLNDSIDSNDIKFGKLYLLENKKIKFDLKNKKITGTWRAGDDGDRTFIEFNIDGINYQGVIIGKNNEIIQILNPNNFISDNLIELSFIKKPDGSDISTQ
ncbi:hypothetical protein BZL53_10270 [Flavobacterium columnare]|nr:hypothetical protein BZL53_10270 [Flavobacterium columnare]